MSEHLTQSDIDGFIRHTLSPGELLRADEHIANCPECSDIVASALPANVPGLRSAFVRPERDPHLSFEQIAAFVDGGLDDVDREIAEFHLHNCKGCSEEVRDLENLKTDLTDRASLLPDPVSPPLSLWERIRAVRVAYLAVPATAVLLAGILFAGWFFGVRKPESEIASVAVPDGNGQGSTLPSPTPAIPANGNTSIEKPETAVSLVDGSARIELDANGGVTGLNGARFGLLVAGVLSGNNLEISPEARELRRSSGTLMGDGAPGTPFSLTSPVGKIVESDRPQFRWRPLTGAESYTVTIYDANFTKIATSPDLRQPAWTPSSRLKRGGVYQWQVTALKAGEEIKSPVRPAPDARFKIIDSAAANDIDAARRTNGNSHLLFGIVYSRAGLLDEAEREFQALLSQNPRSEVARRLLNKIKAAR